MKKFNIEGVIKSAYFIDGEKYIKERMDKLLTSEYRVVGCLPDEPDTKIIDWVDPELEGIVLYIPAQARAYMTVM